ncbi:unnamed protein product [Rotaria sp. Silwood2]|nr:unnamed protein product [Rotaria sp. Silwood2]CAF4645575.1 unnamed protein product [Rotaria sp. Silwood2]
MKGSSNKNILSKEQTYAERIKVKRILSKKFDKEWKRKRAATQIKWRRKKAEEQQQQQLTISTPNTSSSNSSDLRKKAGQKRRRMNISKLKNENTELRKTVRTLTKEIEKLRATRPLTPPSDSPSKVFFDNIKNLPRSTSRQIRDKFGVNLSKQSVSTEPSRSSLQTHIEDFLSRDDISKLCPDEHKQIDGNQIRYRLNHLNILHQQFELECNIDIDYVTFTRYVPSYIKKPNHDSWGTCLCMVCLNPQLQYEKLHQLKNRYSCIKSIVESTPVDLYDLAKDDIKVNEFKENLDKLNRENIVVTFYEW